MHTQRTLHCDHRTSSIAHSIEYRRSFQRQRQQVLLMLSALAIIALQVMPVPTSLLAVAQSSQANAAQPMQPVLNQLAVRQPDRLVDVIVRYNGQADAVREQIATWGGTLTQQLDFIHGFAAQLPARFLPLLAKLPNVRSVSLDAPTYSSSGESDGQVTLIEAFDDTLYANATGSADWPSNALWRGSAWAEIGESDGPDVGDIALVRFLGGQVQGVRLQGSAKGLQSSLNLSDAVTATATLTYRRKGLLDEADALRIEVSTDDGATWQEVGRITGPATDETLQRAQFDLSGFAGKAAQIRLITSDNLTAPKVIYVDDVQVQYAAKREQAVPQGNAPSMVFLPSVSSNQDSIADKVSPAANTQSAEAMGSRDKVNRLLRPEATDGLLFEEDTFWSQSYGNVWGSAWSGNWVENDPRGWSQDPASGSVYISSDSKLTLNDYPYSGVQPNIWRKLNLSNVSAATLAIAYSTSSGVDAADSVVLEISRDGGTTYNVLENFTNITGYRPYMQGVRRYNISGYASANTAIRFRVASGYTTSDENFVLAGVAISYDQVANNNGWVVPIPYASQWSYLDTGSDQGTAWRNAGFGDGSWKKSTGTFGYGNGYELTNVGYGSNASAKYVTTYFRRTFNVSNAASFNRLDLYFLVDDGAVFYLNGVEIGRNNMPTGNIAYNTYAAGEKPDANEAWESLVGLPATALRDGENVLAVEVHQGSASSPDMLFDMGLFAYSTCLDCINSSTVPTYTRSIKADTAWNLVNRVQGQNIAVAVVDSGLIGSRDFSEGTEESRIVASVNFANNTGSVDDLYGHGSHIAGIIAGNGSRSAQRYSGVAPKAKLVDVRVTNDLGIGSTSNVVAGLQWIFDNRNTYNIKVVNVSLNSSVAESYHTSPLDAALEILWVNGIVVVVSGGNNGVLFSGTVFPPANDPFVISVGAVDDKGTTAITDDTIPAWSASGTTSDGFAKPDLVAPGANIISVKSSDDSNLALLYPANQVSGSFGKDYFRMSGTSMASAVVAGAAALLPQDEPNLTPDQVKYRLTSTANKTWTNYNAARAGAGYLDVSAAINSTNLTSANGNVLLSALSSGGVYLSDLNPTYYTNGWGPFERDRSNGETAAGDGRPLLLNGQLYRKGLGVHADSDLRYSLGGQYTHFVADIGVDDECSIIGSVVFQVYADNVKVYDSGVMYYNSANKRFIINVAGKQELRLVVNSGGDGYSCDHGDWGNAVLLKNGQVWNSVNWSSVNWSSVNWSSVNWSSVNWSSDYMGQ